MRIPVLFKIFIISYLFLICLVHSSCIKAPKSIDFTFLIDETLLNDSLPLVINITKFNCQTCPINMAGYQDMLVPGKNSNIIIYNDSTKTARNFKIYNYNFFENFAKSSVSPNRYFNHLNAQIEKGFLNNPSFTFSIDSLVSTVDSTFIVFTNFESPLINTQPHISSLKDMPNNILQNTISFTKIKEPSIKYVLIYAKPNINLPNGPSENFNPKKEVYNTMRSFYEHLTLLYIKSYTTAQKEAAKSLILQSFSQDAIFEIQNKDESSPTKYKIVDFLNRVTSNDRFQYDDVSFFMNNFSFLQEPMPVTDAEIPGELKSIASFDQNFQAKNKGVIVYEDEVNKNVAFSIDKEIIADQTDGHKRSNYKYIIESVTVNYISK